MNIKSSTHVGAHEKNQRPFWKRKVTRFGIPIWAFLAVFLAATMALAAIILRAELTGNVDSGAEVEFVWATDEGTGYGDSTTPLTVRYMLDNDGDGAFDDVTSTIPAPLDCTADIVNGELQVAMTGGWLPGEGCGVANSAVYNPSSVDVTVIEWDFGTSDLGLLDSGQPVEVYPAVSTNLGADAGLPSLVSAGSAHDFQYVVFKVDDAAPFSTTFNLDGTAIIGQTTR